MIERRILFLSSLTLGACASEGPLFEPLGSGVPLPEAAVAILEGGSNFGWVETLGDLDGDGRSDVVTTHSGMQTPDDPFERAAPAVSYGGALPAGITPYAPDAILALDEEARGINSDWIAFAAGDLDGDGLDELVVSSWSNCFAEESDVVPSEAFVIYGSATRLSASAPLRDAASAVLHGDQPCEIVFAHGVGDLDADGYDDLMIERWDTYVDEYETRQRRNFRNAIRYGGPARWTDGPIGGDAVLHVPDEHAQAMVVAGDLDGDGAADLASQSRPWSVDGTRVKVVWGGARLAGDLQWEDQATLVSDPVPHGFLAIPDLDGDGADELGFSGAWSELTIAYGGARLDGAAVAEIADASITASGEEHIRDLDPEAADLDGDGRVDLAIGISSLGGGVFVLPGAGARLSGSIDLSSDAPAPFRGGERSFECEPSHDMGDHDSVCSAGEVAGAFMATADQDGDGDAELLVGAPLNWIPGPLPGRIYVLE